jgi:hypothetical protein
MRTVQMEVREVECWRRLQLTEQSEFSKPRSHFVADTCGRSLLEHTKKVQRAEPRAVSHTRRDSHKPTSRTSARTRARAVHVRHEDIHKPRVRVGGQKVRRSIDFDSQEGSDAHQQRTCHDVTRLAIVSRFGLRIGMPKQQTRDGTIDATHHPVCKHPTPELCRRGCKNIGSVKHSSARPQPARRSPNCCAIEI